jgi:hypothetical protein
MPLTTVVISLGVNEKKSFNEANGSFHAYLFHTKLYTFLSVEKIRAYQLQNLQ